jgi:hypothetical protein
MDTDRPVSVQIWKFCTNHDVWYAGTSLIIWTLSGAGLEL